MITLRFITDTGDPQRQTIYKGYSTLQTNPLAGQVRNDRFLAYTIEPVYKNPINGIVPLLLPDFNPATDTFQVAIGNPDTEATGGTFGLGIKAATISTSSVANPTVISTSAPHLLVTGNTVYISGHTGSTPTVTGPYTVTVTGASTFTIPVSVTVGGTGGTVYLTKNLTALAYNVSAATLQTAFSADMVQLGYSACTITVDTDDTAPFLSFTISANAVGAIPSGLFLTLGANLFPQCDVTINEVDLGSATTPYRLILVVRQAPCVLGIPATTLAATGVTRTNTQVLTASSNAIDTITFNNVDPVSGSFQTDGSGNGVTRTCGTAIWNMGADDFQTLLENNPKFLGNVRVTKSGPSGSAFIVEFTNQLGPLQIDEITLASPTIIETTTEHNYSNGQTVEISGSNSTPTVNGARVVTVIDSTHFSVPVNVTTAGTTAIVIPDSSPSIAVTDVDLAAPVGFSGVLNLNTQNLWLYSLTQDGAFFTMYFSITRTRDLGGGDFERRTIYGPAQILLSKDLLDPTTLVPLHFDTYLTLAEANILYAKLLGDNTLVGTQTIDLTGIPANFGLLVIADVAQAANLLDIQDSGFTSLFAIDPTGQLVCAGDAGFLQDVSVGGLIIPNGGIFGTPTNDSATAGNVGQITSSLIATGSATSLTTATAKNVTSISLTAGDWDVEGNVNFNLTGATMTASSAGISATSATLPTDGTEVASGVVTTALTAVNGISLPRKRISIASTTTIYLVASATFTLGTEAAYGAITARRVR